MCINSFLDNHEQNFAVGSEVFLRINAVRLTKHSLTTHISEFPSRIICWFSGLSCFRNSCRGGRWKSVSYNMGISCQGELWSHSVVITSVTYLFPKNLTVHTTPWSRKVVLNSLTQEHGGDCARVLYFTNCTHAALQTVSIGWVWERNSAFVLHLLQQHVIWEPFAPFFFTQNMFTIQTK